MFHNKSGKWMTILNKYSSPLCAEKKEWWCEVPFTDINFLCFFYFPKVIALFFERADLTKCWEQIYCILFPSVGICKLVAKSVDNSVLNISKTTNEILASVNTEWLFIEALLF